ncbi:MAG TPA: hypothetical protein VF627_02320 [Abditibacterium sp.]|jgi:hypothetical protein
MNDDSHWLQIGVAAQLSRSYGADERDFLETLALLLQNALPDAIEIERGGAFWAKVRPVKSLKIQLGDNLFALQSGAGPLRAQITRRVRGVAIKTEVVAQVESFERL